MTSYTIPCIIPRYSINQNCPNRSDRQALRTFCARETDARNSFSCFLRFELVHVGMLSSGSFAVCGPPGLFQNVAEKKMSHTARHVRVNYRAKRLQAHGNGMGEFFVIENLGVFPHQNTCLLIAKTLPGIQLLERLPVVFKADFSED